MAKVSPDVIISGLVKRGVPLHVAQGVTARLNGESGLDPGINEINPTVKGSRGGYGLAQWTGPRRRQYESFARDRGAPLHDVDTQLDFLMWENANTEKNAWSKVMGAKDAVEAASLFTTEWERPGTPHLGATIKTAQQYAGITPSDSPTTSSSTGQTASTTETQTTKEETASEPDYSYKPTFMDVNMFNQPITRKRNSNMLGMFNGNLV